MGDLNDRATILRAELLTESSVGDLEITSDVSGILLTREKGQALKTSQL